eukprot:UN04817
MEDKNAIKKIKTFLREKQIENHLFIPNHILKDPMQLIQYDSNGNPIRLIYDSHDDIKTDTDSDVDVDVDMELVDHESQNKNKTKPFIQMLIDQANKMCENDPWITGKCGTYGIRNPNH